MGLGVGGRAESSPAAISEAEGILAVGRWPRIEAAVLAVTRRGSLLEPKVDDPRQSVCSTRARFRAGPSSEAAAAIGVGRKICKP